MKNFLQQKFAIKMLKIKPMDQTFREEVEVFRQLDHPNLIRFCEVYVSSDRVHIVMELCTGPNLKQHCAQSGKVSESEAKQIFHQICLGLHFLHSNLICHRDIKLENILFFDQSKKLIKIIDFGFSK